MRRNNMAEKKLLARTPSEEKVVIRSIRAEVEKLLAIKNDTKLWEQLRETYYNYSCVSITVPNVGTTPQQMLWCAPMFPNSLKYWLNIPPMGRQHLLLLPVVGSGMRIDTLRENLKSQLGI
jgi:hypothetical protein